MDVTVLYMGEVSPSVTKMNLSRGNTTVMYEIRTFQRGLCFYLYTKRRRVRVRKKIEIKLYCLSER